MNATEKMIAVEGANTSQVGAYVASQEDEAARAALFDALWDEAHECLEIDGQPIDMAGIEQDEDFEFMNSPRWRERLHQAIDAAIKKRMPNRLPFETLKDIDERGTHAHASAAVRAALDALGVVYDSIADGASTNYIFVHKRDNLECGNEHEDSDGLTLKLRFADHANQSSRHSCADFNWVQGGKGDILEEMIDTARAFYDGASDAPEGRHHL